MTYKYKLCPTCKGAGWIAKENPPRWVLCETCNGVGQVIDASKPEK